MLPDELERRIEMLMEERKALLPCAQVVAEIRDFLKLPPNTGAHEVRDALNKFMEGKSSVS